MRAANRPRFESKAARAAGAPENASPARENAPRAAKYYDVVLRRRSKLARAADLRGFEPA